MSEINGDIKAEFDDDTHVPHKKLQDTEDHIVEQPSAADLKQEPDTTTTEAIVDNTPTERCLDICSWISAVLLCPFSLAYMFECVDNGDKAVVKRRRTNSVGKVKGPGCIFVNQCLNTVTIVNVRTKQYDIKFRTSTKDQYRAEVNAIVSLRVIDPLVALNNFKEPKETIKKMETNILHNSLEAYNMAEILLKREDVLNSLKNIVEDATESLGVEIESVEITDVSENDILGIEGDLSKTKITKSNKTEQAAEVIETSVDIVKCCLDCIECLGDDD